MISGKNAGKYWKLFGKFETSGSCFFCVVMPMLSLHNNWDMLYKEGKLTLLVLGCLCELVIVQGKCDL